MKIAEKRHPATVPSLIARFMHFSARMAAAARELSQMLILGAGFDTRPLWWPGLAGSDAVVIEVDLPEVIAAKQSVLAARGIAYPSNIRPVGCDLTNSGLLARVEAAGYVPARATAVFLEGVIFFLPPGATAGLVDPRTLRLGSGSRLVFDYVNNAFISANNANRARWDSRLRFEEFPFPDDAADLTQALAGFGYAGVAVTPLAEVVRRRWPDDRFPRVAGHAAIVEATVLLTSISALRPGRTLAAGQAGVQSAKQPATQARKAKSQPWSAALATLSVIESPLSR